MFKSPLQELTSSRPIELHYLYGVNCYQHAIGLKTPFLNIDDVSPTRPELKVFFYVTVSPGTMDQARQENLHGKAFEDRLFECCEMDGIIITQNRFEQRNNHRTLAIFIGEVKGISDFHFACLNPDGKWEDKVPFRGVRFHDTTTQIENATGYKFLTYAIVPENITPVATKKLVTSDAVLNDGTKSTIIKLVENPAGDSHILTGKEILVDLNKKNAFEPISKALVPMPLLPKAQTAAIDFLYAPATF